MAEFTLNRTPLFVAGLTFVMELGSKLPWPISGAVSAGMATGLWLAFCDELLVYPKKQRDKPVVNTIETSTPSKKWWWKPLGFSGGNKTD